MTNSRCKGRCAPLWTAARPAFIGLLAAFAVMLALIAAFSLFFLIIESIADSAIIPLALIAATAGCFFGAYICARTAGCRGVIFGAIVGTLMFAILWIVALFSSDCIFGTENIIKLVLLVGAGSVGGYLGCSRKSGRR